MSDKDITQPACSRCRYATFATQMGAKALFCHAEPPTLAMLPAQRNVHARDIGFNMAGMWPPVEADGWCGKFEQESTL
jgi:hypothetical protein